MRKVPTRLLAMRTRSEATKAVCSNAECFFCVYTKFDRNVVKLSERADATGVKKRSKRKEVFMKREFLKAIEGLSDEAIDKIMAENGKDIEAEKAKAVR